MEISKLEILLRAVELGSLTKAAEEFEYSASAISQMLNSIENEIGTRLINRKYSGIDVADGMEGIFKLFEKIIKSKNQIIKLAAEKNKGSNTITIATYASISKYLLPNAIKAFKELHPYTEVNIIVSDKLGDVWKKGLADVYFGERVVSGAACWIKLTTDPYVAVLPESYKCTQDSISCSELLSSNFIMANDRKIYNYIKRNLGEDMIYNNSDDDTSIIELVKADMCVSILPQLAVCAVTGIQQKSLTPHLKRDLGITYNKNDLLSKKYLKNFINYLQEYTINQSK